MVKWFRINRITLWQSPSWKRIFNFLGISHSTYFYHCFDQLDIIQLGQKDENLELVFVFILQTWAIKSSDGLSRTVQNILTKSVDLNRKSIFEVVINCNQQLVKPWNLPRNTGTFTVSVQAYNHTTVRSFYNSNMWIIGPD